jgi:hypothetical protein
MKLPIKFLLGALAAGSVTGLAFFGWSVKAKDDATFQLANGVQVRPVEVKPDDMAQLLDARIWKFDVSLPQRRETYNYALVLIHHGTIVGTLGSVAAGPVPGGDGEDIPNPMLVTVGIVPMDDSLAKSRQARYSIRVYGVGTKGTFTNPFSQNYNYSDAEQIDSDKSIVRLMSGRKNTAHGLSDEDDVAIGFKIEPLFTKH